MLNGRKAGQLAGRRQSNGDGDDDASHGLLAALSGHNELESGQQLGASEQKNTDALQTTPTSLRQHPLAAKSRLVDSNERDPNGDAATTNRRLAEQPARCDGEREPDERQLFIGVNSDPTKTKTKTTSDAITNRKQQQQRARLAKQESITERGDCCSRMLEFMRAKKSLIIPLILLVIYVAAIYCLPFIHIDPKIPNELPTIPFDFQEGPLKPSSASAFKIVHLFKDQIHGPESLAFDSQANLYMAIEGGFVLYAHLNGSSPMRRAYMSRSPAARRRDQASAPTPELIKIAELNGASGLPRWRGQPRSPDECQLDERVYGPQLFLTTEDGFKSKVRVSRCSKPLGIRLNADESQLYVIDTLNGLYRVQLSGQRQVTKLVDFRAENGFHVLPAIHLADEPQQADGGGSRQTRSPQPVTRLMNVSMKALDDLVIERTADGHDLIYMTVASQTWPATSFVFDALEGRPSGLLLRYNTATNQLVVLEPASVAHVRTSVLDSDAADRLNRSLLEGRGYQPSVLLGAPRLDEDDTFDDRPLNFPNGLELTDDRQALLVADTSNKRIIRHFIRGVRRGTSDLWAWTPMYPDNIRRGYDKHQETYWVVGCGKAPASGGMLGEHRDMLTMLRTWPRLRKFMLKNIYFVGYLTELFGEKLLNSNRIQDFGYELRTGSSLCASGCPGMMIVQYNRHGDVIRSIHSREFPNDLVYFSQVNEIIDPEHQEHVLYLGSPSYSYLTKLTLPADSAATLDGAALS
jgi:hypothetical protein